MKKSKSLSLGEIIILIILTIFSICSLYPFLNLYIYAFNDGLDSIKGNLFLWPRKFTLDNIISALAYKKVINGVYITILRTLIGTVTHIICISSLGYAMTKRHIIGYKLISNYFFVVFMFSGGFIPYYLLLKEIHLINTFWVYIIPGLYSYWNMIIFRSYFDSMPQSIEESAKVDGASYLKIYFHLIIPLARPVFAAITLFTAVGHWNDWFAGAFYVKTSALRPLQTVLQMMINESVSLEQMAQNSISGSTLTEYAQKITPASIKQAVFVITVTPIVMIYPFMQKYFAKGIMLGAVKG